jgi:spoIIIJ-associated protein
LSANVLKRKKKLQVNNLLTIVDAIKSGKEWLEQLLDIMYLDAEVSTQGFETVMTDSNSNWLNIDASKLSVEQKAELIGNKGESIDAIQYLANTILNLDVEPEAQSSFTIELDGYRVERNRELTTLTQAAIDEVKATGQEVEIPNLSSAERKHIHFLLENVEGLTSESRGQEPNRNLVVRPQ